MEVYVCPQMIAAGVEAMQEGKARCLTEAELATEIYLAMYLMGVKATCEREETLH